jgi:hypothetical protein
MLGATVGGIASIGFGIANTLLTAYARQKEQDARHNQMVWETEGRNIAGHGKALRDRDAYNQAAGAINNTATRAYFLEDVKLGEQLGLANLASQKAYIELIGGSDRGSAKGLRGSTADRLNSQALKIFGQKSATIAHGFTSTSKRADVDKETAQINASNDLRITRGERGSTIFAPTPSGPTPVNPIPEMALGIGQGLFNLWSSNSGQSPFNFPEDTGGRSFVDGMNSGFSSGAEKYLPTGPGAVNWLNMPQESTSFLP